MNTHFRMVKVVVTHAVPYSSDDKDSTMGTITHAIPKY